MVMKKEITPNFFLIGAPKCGTTALSEYLGKHPNVFFSNPKEPEYFATDFEGRVITNERDYLRLFQTADPSRHWAIGEGSVLYMFSKVAVSNILQFQPNAKFIVMLRNPTDLVISLHAQLLTVGNENLFSFLDAWNAESDRHVGKRIPVGCRDPQWLYYSEWGKLGTQLKKVLEIVPQRQLKVILFDDFVRDTPSVYRDVLEFLDLPDDGRTEFPKINERRSPRIFLLQTFLGTVMRFWLPLRTKLTLGKGFGFGNYLTKLNTTTAEKNRDPEVHQVLAKFYKDEVLLLESLLNRDLGDWQGENRQ
jgi:hypothetical protein